LEPETWRLLHRNAISATAWTATASPVDSNFSGLSTSIRSKKGSLENGI
jgi:hypothetical protein